MRKSFLMIGAMMPLFANAQILWSDNFDTYAQGSLSGQGGWVSTLGSTNVVEGGNGRPSADTPFQMSLQQPTTGSIMAHLPTGWNTRTAGNNTLVLRGALFVSSGTANLGSAVIQVVGSGGVFDRMGYVGIANSQFIFGTGSNITFGPNATLGQWNYLRLEVDTVAKMSYMYTNDLLVGSEAYDSQLTDVNAWGFQTIALGGSVSNPVYFDTMQAEAVPEPLSLGILGLAAAIVARRKIP